MFKKVFNNLFKKEDEAPALPEERGLPKVAWSLNPPAEIWVTTQVFAGKKGQRTYYAFVYKENDHEGEQRIYSCTYKAAPGVVAADSSGLTSEGGFANAVKRLHSLEEEMIAKGELKPVIELRGNYRDVSSLQGLHFNDKGDCIPIGPHTVVTSEALFRRETLDRLYGEIRNEVAKPTIATWDDFYSQIVNKYPAVEGDLALQQVGKFSSGEGATTVDYSDFVAKSVKLLAGMKDFHKKMTDSSLSLRSRQALLPQPELRSYIEGRSENEIRIQEEYRAGQLRAKALENYAEYQYQVAGLAVLVRAGGEIYRQFAATIPADQASLKLLKEVGSAIRTFAVVQLRLSSEVAEQLAKLIVQGADPYADKPLPLETLCAKYLPSNNSSTAAPKKSAPKNYSP